MGGTAPYTYAWDNGSTTEDLTAVPVGTYCVVVTDANGCTVEGCVELISEDECCPDIYVQVSVVVDENCGESNGTAAVVPVGSPAGYNFMWDNGSTDSLQTGLAPGVYCVTITADVAGCPAGTEYCITVGSLEGPAIEVVSTSDATCNDADGSAMVNVLSGTPPYTYVWDNSVTTASNPGLTAGMYCVTVTDADGCSEVGCVEIDMTPGSLTLNMSGTDTDCGAATGSVEAVIGGGLAPFTYTWSPALGNAAMHNNVGAGTYCVTVTDANGCVVEDCVAVGETGGPSLTADASTDVLCIGDASGVITSSSTGDISVYDMEGNLVGSGPVVSGLIAGEYTVVATDASGCETRELVEIEEPSEVLDLEMSEITPADCISGLGNVGIDVMGGTAPYTYIWNNAQTTQDLTAVVPGTYCVTVTDANGCIVEGCVELTSEELCCPEINIQASVVNDANCGETNGSAAVIPTGATSYTYRWVDGNGAAITTDSLATNLAPGTYTVYVSADVLGCLDETEYTVTVGTLEGPEIDVTVDMDSECGMPDGEASVSILSGTPPYTYNWSPNGETTASITGLTPGDYCVTVTDADGCLEIGCVTVIATPGPLTLGITSTNTDCGAATGSVTATASNGTEPYTYVWGPPVGNTGNINNLPAGTYCVTVTDAIGCTTSECVTISEDGGPALTAVVSSDVDCYGTGTGEISSTVASGVIVTVYDDQNNLVGSGPIVTGLNAGTYTVVAVDASGCQTSDILEVIQPKEQLDLELTGMIPADCINQLGDLEIDVMGGTPPYTFDWNSGAYTTEDLTSVPAGTYCVVVMDANGCTLTGCFDLTLEDDCCPDIDIQASVVIDANCGEMNGTAAVIPVGADSYLFRWFDSNNALVSTDSLATGLVPGSYTVYVAVNDPLCPDQVPYTISVGTVEGPAILVSVDMDSECGEPTGEASVSVLSGTAPYTYLWTNGEATSSITGLTAGEYCVTVTDADGCPEVGCVIIETTPGPLELTMNSTNADCGVANGSVTASASNGTEPYTYTWSPAIGNTATVTNIGAGTYCVTVTDVNGCMISECITVSENGGPALSAMVSSDVNCFAGSDGEITTTVATGVTASVYDINGTLVGAGSVVGGLSAGTYTVVAVDASGCQTSDILEIQQPEEQLDLELTGMIPADCINQLGDLEIDVMGGTPPYTFDWNSGAYTTEDLTSVPAGTYCVVVTDANGCTLTGCFDLTLEDDCCPDIDIQASVVVDANCGEMNGTAAVIPVGADSYLFRWFDSNNALVSTDSLATGLVPGSYTVYVAVNDPLCPDQVPYTISVGTVEGPAILVSVDMDSECGEPTGEASVSVLSGTAPYTYLWTNGEATSSITGLTAGEYCVTVTDADGCPEVGCVIIETTPGPLELTMNSTNADCGVANGSVTASASNGTEPYTYTWSPAIGNTATVTNIGAGTYCVTVTDVNGCMISECITVSENGGPALSAMVSSDVNCFAGSDGEITSTVATGVTVSVYDMNGTLVGAGSVVGGLSAGTYTVVAVDASGCQTSDILEIQQPEEQLDLELTGIVPADCISGLGNIEIDVMGGTPPYTYSWNGGAYTSEDLFSVLPGMYCVEVMDVNGCTLTACYELTAEEDCCPDINIQASVVVDANCGESNGTAAVIPTGATSYLFRWFDSNNQVVSTDSIATGLAAGSYTVYVAVNDPLCPAQVPYTVAVGNMEGPEILVAPTRDAECGDPTGSASVTVLAGTAPYTYLWNDIVATTTPTITGLAAGTYCVTVTDVDGCIEVGCVEIKSTPGPLQLTMSSVDTECGLTNGSVTALASNGAEPYIYEWDPNVGSTPTLNNQGAGTYCVTVTDASGCMIEGCVTISETNGPSLTTVITSNIDCHGGFDGEITSTVDPGVSVTVYDAANNIVGSSSVVGGLQAGFYTVVARDVSTGCQTSDIVEIQGPEAPLDLEITAVDPADCIGGVGNIDIDVEGGTPAYTYIWMPGGATSQDLVGVAPGTYCVTVTDANGCTLNACVDLMSEEDCCPDIAIQASVVVDANCGESNGSAAVIPSGANSYQFRWFRNGMLVSSDSIATGLSVGAYTVYVAADIMGCPVQVPYTVAVGSLEGPQIDVTPISDATCLDNNGSAEVIIINGDQPYTYEWSSGATGPIATNLTVGVNTVTVTDINGCPEVAVVEIGNSSGNVTLSVNGSDADCNMANGTIQADVTGAVSPITYMWSTGETSQNLTNKPSGTYCVTVTDAVGCVAIGCGTINDILGPTFTAVVSQNVLCISTATGVIQVTADPDVTIVVLDQNMNIVGTSSVTTGLPAGEYTVQGTDNNGCTTSELLTITEPMEVLDLEITVLIPATCETLVGDIEIDVMGGTPPHTYSWNGGTYTSQDLFNVPAGTYNIVVTDANGCTISANIPLAQEQDCCPDIYVQASVVIDTECDSLIGTAAVVPVGSATGYTFEWQTETGTFVTNDSIATDLGPGIYRVFITANASGCPVGTSYTVNVGTQSGPSIEVVSTSDATCDASDGSATVSVTGIEPLDILWSTGATTATVDLPSGEHYVTVTDSLGCMETAIVEVGETMGNLLVGVTSIDANCGASDGTASVIVIGAATPVDIQWSYAGATSNSINNVPAGAYSVTVTDANGCTDIGDVIINNVAGPSLSVSVFNDVFCKGGASGTITAVVDPGVEIEVHNEAGLLVSTMNPASGLVAGKYSVTAIADNGCKTTRYAIIDEPAEVLDLILTARIMNCDERPVTGSLYTSVTGGTAPYTYVWDDPAMTMDAHLIDADLGEYNVTVTDANGCTISGGYMIDVGRCAVIGHTKTIARFDSLESTGGHGYNVSYEIIVCNEGGKKGPYDLIDSFAFDDDLLVHAATFTSTMGLSGAFTYPDVSSGSMLLAMDQDLGPYSCDTFLVVISLTADLDDDDPVGDNTYTSCGDNGSMTGHAEGEGLFNQSLLDFNSDGTIDEMDTACIDIPYVTHTKMLAAMDSLIQIDPMTNTWQVVYQIDVTNKGGVAGMYDLIDSIAFDDDMVVTAVSYTKNGAVGPFTLSPMMPVSGWLLDDDVTLLPGETNVYLIYVTFNFSFDPADPVGDNQYTQCGTTSTHGGPVAGEALFNLSLLDIDNDGMEDERDTACIEVCTEIRIACPADVTIDCAADTSAAAVGIPTIEFSCCPPVTMGYTDEFLVNCGTITNIRRTWIANDACGNADTCVQMIIREDNTPPVFANVPADVTIDCTDSVPMGVPTATDNCDTVNITSVDGPFVADPNCPQAGTIIRTFTACDGCNNCTTVTQTVTIIDDTPPVVSDVPADVTIDCTAPLPTDIPTGVDDCGDVTVTATDGPFNPDPLCPNGGTVLRTFEICDECGNCVTETQLVTIIDVTAPTFTWNHPSLNGQPLDGAVITIECQSQTPGWAPPAFDTSAVNVTDDCGTDIALSLVEVEEYGDCTVDGFFWRVRCTFIASDECGNTDSAWFFLEIVDTQAPIISNVPGDVTISCGDPIPPVDYEQCPDAAAGFDVILITDACECATVEVTVDSIPGSCPGSYDLLRTWTAEDNCGNISSATQRVSIIDDTAPTFGSWEPHFAGLASGDTLAGECEGLELPDWVWGLNPTSVFATDECSGVNGAGVQFTHTYQDNQYCQDGYIELHVFTWTATDNCGNVGEYVFYFGLEDNTPPVIEGIDEYVCGPIASGVPTTAYVTDNCTATTTITYSEFTEVDPCTGDDITHRVYRVSDGCGNIGTFDQYILTTSGEVDLVITDPNITADFGDTVRVDCGSLDLEVLAEWSAGVAVDGDLCPGSTGPHFELLENEADCADGHFLLYEARWTLNGVCGVGTSESIYIAVEDNTAPTWPDFDAQVLVNCGDGLPAVEADDNCTAVAVTDSILVDSCIDGTRVIRRQVILTDACSNTRTYIQEVAFDGEGNIFIEGVPENDVVCGDFDITDLRAWDECLQDYIPVVIVQDDFTNCGSAIIRTITYEVDGLCGDVLSGTFQIITGDETGPTVTAIHPDLAGIPNGGTIEIECDQEYENLFDADDVSAIDICSGEATVDFSYQVIDITTPARGDCATKGYKERHQYTWAARDACGNVTEHIVYVNVVDNTPPELFNIPPDMTVYCEPIDPQDVVTYDNCGTAFISYSQQIESDGKKDIYRRTWLAYDDCGNSTSQTQVLTVLSSSAAELECELVTPDVVYCNSDNNVVTVNVTGGQWPYTYKWTVEGGVCSITSGNESPTITFSIGYSDAIIQVLITDDNGCQTICTYNISCINDKGSTITSDPTTTINENQATHVAEEAPFALYQNVPNPFDDYTVIAFHMPHQGSADLEIYDTDGQVVKTISGEYEEGHNEIVIDAKALPSAEVLYYTLSTEGYSATKRMVLIK